ncbi:FHA domain-containing protein [Archangium violaceum]|uniref:FHA domain-containing protein n=1 Tax=Archangium violaceum TaxID=83451 RepID=UPI00194EF32C|nr:FHA domain-containing protein [Archangium violaceum]QRO01207.1 FHA domain-containing protein [Archangium violaceum]
MSNGSPPARRRPTTGSPSGGATSQRPSVRKTSTGASSPAVRSESVPVTGTKLVCSAGPRAGEEFGLEDGEYVVGRANDNPICIPDTSVSRKHVLIRRVGGGWAASDLGSGNGTLLNGEPLTDEMPLSHGDVLTLGDTELTFNDSSNATMMMPAPSAPPSRPARSGSRSSAPASAPEAADTVDEGAAPVPRRPPPRPDRVPRGGRSAAAPDPAAQQRKKRLLILTAGVFVMLVGLLVVMKVQQQNKAEAAALQARQVQERREALDALFQDAKNLIRESNWVGAKAKLLELQEAEPEYLQLQDYLARVEKEIPNQEAINTAKAALDKGQLATASAALAKVSKDTQLFESLRTLKTSMQDKADKRVREAQALLEQRQLDPARQAKAITDDVLAAFPEHRDAKVIAEQVDLFIENATRPAPVVKGPEAPKPWDQAVDLFRDGDLRGAVAMANSCAGKNPQCKTLIAQMTDFDSLYKKLEDLDAKGLARLLDLDRKITNGRGSKLSRNAGTRAANIFFKSASAAKAAGQWGRAMENAQRALQSDPSHAGANNIVTELRQKAKDLYLQAYALKDTNPEDAVPKFREVMAMTLADDETHQKSKSWIEKLQR